MAFGQQQPGGDEDIPNVFSVRVTYYECIDPKDEPPCACTNEGDRQQCCPNCEEWILKEIDRRVAVDFAAARYVSPPSDGSSRANSFVRDFAEVAYGPDSFPTLLDGAPVSTRELFFNFAQYDWAELQREPNVRESADADRRRGVDPPAGRPMGDPEPELRRETSAPTPRPFPATRRRPVVAAAADDEGPHGQVGDRSAIQWRRPRESRGDGCPGTRGARRRSSVPPCRRSRVIRCAATSWKRPSGKSRRRRCSRRSSSQLASADCCPARTA